MKKEIIQSYIDERELLYKDIYTFEDEHTVKLKRLNEIDEIFQKFLNETTV